MALLLLVKDDKKSVIMNLVLHYAKEKNPSIDVQVQYEDHFSFQKTPDDFNGFFSSLYGLLKYCNLFEDLLGKEESKIASCEELLFNLENDKFEINPGTMKWLNDKLLLQSFIASEVRMSIVDIFYFCVIRESVEKMTLKEKYENLPVCRWFLHMQEVLLNGCDIFSKIEFKEALENYINIQTKEKPKLMYQSLNPKEGAKKELENKKKQIANKKNEEREKKKKELGKGALEVRDVTDFSRLNIRVGYVEEVEIHPDADTLYCLKINLGEEKPRDICSGLRNKKTVEDLLHKHVLVLANLKERTLRGRKSHGMVLCGSFGKEIELLKPPEGVQVGERITSEKMDVSLEPEKQLSSDQNKNSFFIIQTYLSVKDGLAYYKEEKWMSSAGPIECPLAVGSIS